MPSLPRPWLMSCVWQCWCRTAGPLLLLLVTICNTGGIGYGEEAKTAPASPALKLLLLGDNPWNGGTLRHILSALAAARQQSLEIREIPAKGRSLEEVLGELIAAGSSPPHYDAIVVFDHPRRILVQRDRGGLITELKALEGMGAKILWVLSPFPQASLRVEKERVGILARTGVARVQALPLVWAIHASRGQGGTAAWASELAIERPTGLGDYLTACLIGQAFWESLPELPQQITISAETTLQIPQEALSVFRAVAGDLSKVSSSAAFSGDYAPELEAPLPLRAGGQPLATPAAAVPDIYDWDGDGNPDLVLSVRSRQEMQVWLWQADASGFALRQGSKLSPQFSPPTGAPADSATTILQVVDFDHDRHPDLLLGNDQGDLALCRGREGNAFSPPDRLRLANGEPFRVGYLHYAFLGDLDKDGTWDLVIGDHAGQVWLARHLGKEHELNWSPPLPVTIGELPLQVEGQAAAILADWDLDGRNDLIVGARSGGVLWIRNLGSAEKMDWAVPLSLIWPCAEEGSLLVPYREGSELWAPTPGWSAQPAVADLNGDHLPDLITGDANCRVIRFRQLTPEEQREIQELADRREKLLAEIQQATSDKLPSLKATLWEVTLALIQKSTDRRYERCGWVWFFRRKALAVPEE